jgi:flagellar biosynthesis protein FliR
MPGELTFSIGTLLSFLLVLARVAGTFVFLPIPGVSGAPEMARIVLVLSLTIALFPVWPAINGSTIEAGRLTGWILAEAGLGVGIGLAVGLLTEAFQLAAHAIGLQAGYAYAQTVDPATQADSSMLLIFAQLLAGALFFTTGLDREIIRAFARSLEVHPPGTFLLQHADVQRIVGLGADMFSTALRLALPVIAFLALIDIALALLGRINSQLQLLSLAFPIKMLVTLAMLSWILVLFAAVYRSWGGQVLGTVRATLAR